MLIILSVSCLSLPFSLEREKNMHTLYFKKTHVLTVFPSHMVFLIQYLPSTVTFFFPDKLLTTDHNIPALETGKISAIPYTECDKKKVLCLQRTEKATFSPSSWCPKNFKAKHAPKKWSYFSPMRSKSRRSLVTVLNNFKMSILWVCTYTMHIIMFHTTCSFLGGKSPFSCHVWEIWAIIF